MASEIDPPAQPGVTATPATRSAEKQARAAEQQARAEQTLQRIFAGGDLGAETLALSNRFTDETSARWLRRLRRRPSRAEATERQHGSDRRAPGDDADGPAPA
ncbi:hypothetical protein [Schumannella soli]|uniref:Uncharacterized protein n=1 Tax=Schumannella soli TaxID=2590779 RepID=A0A506Y064_9MICO|nr:hypothetical protein [Schumannella soli]TPW75886.1 hypothetical protein FJ657_08540 [Schumannella soli]